MLPPQRSGLVWQRAASCGGGSCVEVAATPSGVAVRDSKTLQGPVLTYSRGEWEAFIEGVKHGEFDLTPP